MEQNKLREKVKKIKEQKAISFTYFAKQIGIQNGSFYNFLNGAKGLSHEKQELLKQVIERFQ